MQNMIIASTIIVMSGLLGIYLIDKAEATPMQVILIAVGFGLMQPVAQVILSVIKEIFIKWKEF